MKEPITAENNAEATIRRPHTKYFLRKIKHEGCFCLERRPRTSNVIPAALPCGTAVKHEAVEGLLHGAPLISSLHHPQAGPRLSLWRPLQWCSSCSSQKHLLSFTSRLSSSRIPKRSSLASQYGCSTSFQHRLPADAGQDWPRCSVSTLLHAPKYPPRLTLHQRAKECRRRCHHRGHPHAPRQGLQG